MILMNSRAALDLLAAGAADVRDAVDDAAERAGPVAVPFDVAGVVAAAVIGVAAGLRQRLAADHEARSLDQPLLDRHDEAVVGAAEVAHGGEAAHQHVAA